MTLAEAIAIRLFYGYPISSPPLLKEAERIIKEETKRVIETYNAEVSSASHSS